MTGRVSSPSAIHFRHQNSCLRKAIWVRHWALTSKSPALRAWQYSRVSSARKMTAYIASTHQPVAVQLIMGLRGSPNDFSSRLNSVRTRSSASHRTSRRRTLVWSGQCPRLLANVTKRPAMRWAAITAETFGVTNRDKVAHRASEQNIPPVSSIQNGVAWLLDDQSGKFVAAAKAPAVACFHTARAVQSHSPLTPQDARPLTFEGAKPITEACHCNHSSCKYVLTTCP